MRWVQAAQARPHRCAFIPFIGGHQPKGYFDFGTEIMAFDGHVYCSVTAAEQMAAAMGWAPAGDAANLKARVRDLEAALEQRGEDIALLTEQLDAVHTLKQAGYQASKRVGRPPKVAA